VLILTCFVASAMNAIERESTLGQTIVAVTNLVNFVMFLPKFGLKMLSGLRFVLQNCKDFGMYLFCALGIVVFVLVLVFYTENEYNLKARLANILVPPPKTAAVQEF